MSEPIIGRGRRVSVLVFAGLALALTTVVGDAWLWLASRSGTGETESVVRLGTAGLITASIGWAAFAPSWVRAAGRAMGAWLIVLAVFLALWSIFVGFSVLELSARGERYSQDGERSLWPTALFGPFTVGSAVFFVRAALLGLLARASVVARGVGRHLATGLLFLFLGAQAVLWFVDGAQVAFVIAVVAVAWLAWALRRARAAHASAASAA